MAYTALYRKWRPDNFEEVKGQEAIVTTLKNQIKNDRLGHAYLFCGTRGTGKTTTAKLVAKTVNCENPVDGSPCGECASCKAIAAGSALNVIEMDAASNNGVDAIRQINNSVSYSPAEGKKLVYIIDEAHQLSTSAFNALLKTLEEPPSYVMFILATTEYHAIPKTILSRCQRFDFKRITIDIIVDRLRDLLEREGVKCEEAGLHYIAKAADGSMRDALSILDQCISFNLGQDLTYDSVLNTVGAVDVETYIKLIRALSEGDVVTCVDVIDECVMQGRDLGQFINEVTSFIRDVLYLKLSPDIMIDVTSENRAEMLDISQRFDEGYLINCINILQEAAAKLPFSTTKRIVLEVAIIKMCKPEMQKADISALEKRMHDLERELEEARNMLANAGNLQLAAANQVSNNSSSTTGENTQNTNSVADNTSGTVALAGPELMAQLEGMLDAKIAEAKLGAGTTDSTSSEINARLYSPDPVSHKKLQEEIDNNYRNEYPEADYTELKAIAAAWDTILSEAMKATATHLRNKYVYIVPNENPLKLTIKVAKNKDTELAQRFLCKTEVIQAIANDIERNTGRKVTLDYETIAAQKDTIERAESHALNRFGINFSKINIKP